MCLDPPSMLAGLPGEIVVIKLIQLITIRGQLGALNKDLIHSHLLCQNNISL